MGKRDKKKRRAVYAYIDDTTSLTYRELARRVRRFAASLLARGIQPEQRMLLVMQDTVDLPVAFLGALYAGVVPVPVNTLLPATDYAYMIAPTAARRPSSPAPRCCPACAKHSPWRARRRS